MRASFGGVGDDRAGAIGQVHRDKRFELSYVEDQRAEISRSRQVVFRAIARSILTLRRDLLVGIDNREAAIAFALELLPVVRKEVFRQILIANRAQEPTNR